MLSSAYWNIPALELLDVPWVIHQLFPAPPAPSGLEGFAQNDMVNVLLLEPAPDGVLDNLLESVASNLADWFIWYV